MAAAGSSLRSLTWLCFLFAGESMAELHLGNSSAPPRPHALQALLALLLQAAVLR